MVCLCQDPALHHALQGPTVKASGEETRPVLAVAYEQTEPHRLDANEMGHIAVSYK